MQSLYNIYNSILSTNKRRGLVRVEDLMTDSGLINKVREKLQEKGYQISTVNDRDVAILFFSLVDILFVVKDDKFVLMTMSNEKLIELLELQRLIPRHDERMLEKTYSIIMSNTVEVINHYLKSGKFHEIKLNQAKYGSDTNFLAQLSGFSPYPSLNNGEQIYTLTNVNNWNKELKKALINGVNELILENQDNVYCSLDRKHNNYIITGGNFIARDINNELIKLPIWQIKDYRPYNENSFINSLLNGVVNFDNTKITLNRDILEKYYGSILYSRLESENIRKLYCLEELMTSMCADINYFLSKYNLKYNCTSVQELEAILKNEVSFKNNKPFIIHARVLGSVNSILAGHKSFYLTINLNKLKSHKYEVMEDYMELMPKQYKYYAISSNYGYYGIDITASTEESAMTLGKKEFERQFGDHIKFCTLALNNKILKGSPIFNLNVNIQRRLCQNLMWGYVPNYKGYAEVLKLILKMNSLEFNEDYVKFLFVNNLARKVKLAQNLKLDFVVISLIDFLTILKNGKAEELLLKEYEKISWRQCQLEYKAMSESFPNLSNYIIKDTPEGKFIETDFGRYKVTPKGINKTIDVLYKKKFIARKIIKTGI